MPELSKQAKEYKRQMETQSVSEKSPKKAGKKVVSFGKVKTVDDNGVDEALGLHCSDAESDDGRLLIAD